MSRNEIPLKVLMIDIPCTEGVVLEKLLTKEKKWKEKKLQQSKTLEGGRFHLGQFFSKLNVFKYGQIK